MKKFATGLSLICAAALLAGIFLPWVQSASIPGLFGGSTILPGSLSGWDVFHRSGLGDLLASMGGSSLQSETHALIVFIASIVMLLCSLAAFILSLKSKGDNAGIVAFGIIISLAAVAAIGGLGWFLIDMSSAKNWSNYIGYGVYVCSGGVVLGLVGGILASVKGK